jgi:hypothetical protein
METLEQIARRAVACNCCFEQFGVHRPNKDDLAQPRWIGPDYFTATPKVIVLMTNPGAGDGADQSIHMQRRKLLKSFLDGQAELPEVLVQQFLDMPNWGNPRGKFMAFIQNGLGLSFHQIALLNVAWCASKGDKYPRNMLDTCFQRHTMSALNFLRPDLIILSGNEAHKYRQIISSVVPSAKITNVLHYAHRKGYAEEEMFNSNVRKIVASLSVTPKPPN